MNRVAVYPNPKSSNAKLKVCAALRGSLNLTHNPESLSISTPSTCQAGRAFRLGPWGLSKMLRVASNLILLLSLLSA